MAVETPAVLLTGDNNVAGTSFAFTSLACGDGTALLAAVRTSRAGTAAVPLSFTALGLTWAYLSDMPSTSGNVRITWYGAIGVSGGGTSVGVDLNDGGGNHSGASVAIVEHPGMNNVTQIVPAHVTPTGLTITASMAAITSGNGVGMWTMSVGNTTLAEEAGYAEALDYAIGTIPSRLHYFWRAGSSDNSPTSTAGTSRELLSLALELTATPALPMAGATDADVTATLSATAILMPVVTVRAGTDQAPQQTATSLRTEATATIEHHPVTATLDGNHECRATTE